MSKQARVIKSELNEVPREVVDLVAAIKELPEEYRKTVDEALGRVVDSTKRRRRILSLVQDALGQLRLDMKYLAFDLEATRRERDEYRRQIEEEAS
jgi:uncharacterized coiled-coil DUF342 family protein